MLDPHTMVTDARALAAKGEVVVLSDTAVQRIVASGYKITAAVQAHDQFGVVRLTAPVFDADEVHARFARGEFGHYR